MRRKRFTHNGIDSIFETAPGDYPPPGRALEESEQAVMVRKALETLPDAQRETIVMKLYGNLTFDQIARRWGVSRATPYRLVLTGKLRARNFGIGARRACWRVHRDDLTNYENSVPSAPPGGAVAAGN